MYLVSSAQLRSSTAGLATILGPLGAEILATLWRLGRATTRDVHRQLNLPRQYAYGTVRAAMLRLTADGYLMCLPYKERNAYVYIPRIAQEALTRQVLDHILDGLAADYPTAVAAYVARYDTARAPHLRLIWAADQQQQCASS
ncbi:MAG: BlaI/MecI/CopY family transcriptional regulator [Roseiflexaceae bacterium]